MKILLVTNSYNTFNLHRKALASCLAKKHEVHLMLPENDKIHLSKLDNFNSYFYPLSRKGLNIFEEFKSIYYLYKVYKQEHFDVIHHFTIKSVLYGSCAAILTGQNNVINSITGLGYVFMPSKKFSRKVLKLFISIFYRLVFKLSNSKIIFQNPDDYQYFLDSKIVNPLKAHLILGSGVNTEKFHPLSEFTSSDRIKILFCSRMLVDKGVVELVEATKILKSKSLNFEMIFAGEPDTGNPSSIDLNFLLQWHQDGLISYLGFCQDTVSLFQHADIVCLPSYREGIPMSLLEAMSCAKPIVTTDVPGCREVVIDEYNGLKVKSHNIDELACALERLILNHNERILWGENSRKLAMDKFSADRIIAQIINLY